MNQNMLIWALLILLVFVAVGWLRCWSDRRKMMGNLQDISKILQHIIAEDTEEKVMSFTDSKDMKVLISSINTLLNDRQKQKAEFIRTEAGLRKMLSNISHDMKTPLTVILGYLEIMEMEENKSPLISKVRLKAGQVMEMMNQFFSLAKLEAGDTPLEMEKVELNEVCRRNILDFYQILREKEYQVEISIPEEKLYTFGNGGALDRILFNLISNALRYGGDGKYLAVSLEDEMGSAVIRITDHGKGIAREYQEHIFERLYTMEDSRNRELQGNGLGLTIVKSLTQKLGGTVEVHSIPEEVTTFTVRMPLLKY